MRISFGASAVPSVEAGRDSNLSPRMHDAGEFRDWQGLGGG